MQQIDDILDERGANYGSFVSHAEISDSIKEIIFTVPADLKPYQSEALSMIVHKIARIVNGNPDYVDSWQDIAGYAQLVVNELERISKL